MGEREKILHSYPYPSAINILEYFAYHMHEQDHVVNGLRILGNGGLLFGKKGWIDSLDLSCNLVRMNYDIALHQEIIRLV